MKEGWLKTLTINLLYFTLAIGALGALLFATWLKPYFLPIYLWMVAVFFLVSLLYSYLLLRAAAKYPERFVSWFMGITGAKLLLYLLFILLYLVFDKENAIPFLLTFLVMYIAYTSLAVYQTLKYVNR